MTASLPAKLAERIELWALADLRPYAGNPREHSPDQLRRIAASISEFGFVNPILVDRETREIIAGHGRLEAARLIGLERVPVVPLDHLSDAQRRAYLIADNRLAELSTWDDDKLRRELEKLSTELPQLPELGFDAGKLRRLLAPTRSSPASVDQVDEVATPQTKAVARLGDVWTIGDQRLVCGDSRTDEARALALGDKAADLVVTDPPYAIYGSSTGVGTDVADDRMVRDFFERTIAGVSASVRLRGHAYIFCDWRSYPAWHAATRGSGLGLANLLVWDKGDFGLGANYRNNYELVLFLHRAEARSSHFDRSAKGVRPVHEPNILRLPRTGQAGFERESEPGERYHNAAKPVDLLRRLVSNSTDVGELVVDLFGGAGSTLIACELTRRRGVAVEIEPRWVDVSVRRLERLVEKSAVLEGDGRTFAELAAARLEETKTPRRRRGKG